jgi:uncharacterized protein YllA (UPF0747 family)
MPLNSIPFRDTNYFSSLICDYLDEDSKLDQFYNRFPKLESFKAQIEEKHQTVTSESRLTLVKVLESQYKNVNASSLTKQNIEALKEDKTYTITTGHQLNLFTGPLYFLYKIISTINVILCLSIGWQRKIMILMKSTILILKEKKYNGIKMPVVQLENYQLKV